MINNIEIDHISIGQKIRKEREKLKLSREEFAEIIGLSDYYIGQLERGERQMSLGVLVKIAKCLHLSLDYLIFGTENHLTYYSYETQELYNTSNNHPYNEITALLNKCSPKELKLIEKLLTSILPYLKV